MDMEKATLWMVRIAAVFCVLDLFGLIPHADPTRQYFAISVLGLLLWAFSEWYAWKDRPHRGKDKH